MNKKEKSIGEKKKGKKERGETTKKKIEETDETREIAIIEAFSSSFAIGRTAFGFYFCHRSARESERESTKERAKRERT